MPIQSSPLRHDDSEGSGGGGGNNGRLVGGGFDGNNDADEGSLRPKRLVEYIGQAKIKDNLGIALAA
ncbi:MAG: hypothetical protein H7145_14525, partial [Akkermansiaceae bacterium]|nr:hypothetical protein [Armatimonadota bacterium]